MAKSFTINTPKYQKAQKEFYAYNVANDESVLNTSNIKSTTFNFHLTNKNMTAVDDNSDKLLTIVYRLDDENTAALISLRDFYASNYDKIIDMSAKGNYIANGDSTGVDSISAESMSANNIFSKDVNAYISNMTATTGSIINSFILTINTAAKAIPTFILRSTSDDANYGIITLFDSFTFGILPAALVDSSEEDESKLAGIFMVYGAPYFSGKDEDNPDAVVAESNISVTIYYMGDDE